MGDANQIQRLSPEATSRVRELAERLRIILDDAQAVVLCVQEQAQRGRFSASDLKALADLKERLLVEDPPARDWRRG